MSEPARAVLVPVFARAAHIDAKLAADDALRAMLAEARAHIRANVPVVVAAKNGEALHQIRVGMRRLRTALKLVPALNTLDARAKAILNTIGAARDLDVFVGELFEPAVAELGPRPGFDIFAARSDRVRRKAWQAAIDTINSAAFGKLDADVVAAAQGLAWQPHHTIAEVAPDLLDHAFKRAKKRGRHFSRLDPPSRHRLRIALKKLRYTSEFLAPLYPAKHVKHWLKPLKELQDLLGHLNDVAQVRGVVGRLMLEEAESARVQADLSHAAGLLQGFHQVRAEQVAEKTGTRWKTFRDKTVFWA